MTTFRLKSTVSVSPDRHRPGSLKQLPAGTALDDVPETELEQLAPGHFVDADGSDALPDDWRTDEAVLKEDRRQAKAVEAETKVRDKARAARRAEKAKARED